MRDTLYRGKIEEDDKWVYGYVWKNPREQYFITEHKSLTMYAVIPETIGESVDMIDDYDNEVFEGDILEFEGYMSDDYYIQIAKSDDAPHNFIMGYRQKLESDVRGISEGIFTILESLPKSCRVIGNIYDKGFENFNYDKEG